MGRKLLIIDDEKNLCDSLKIFLSLKGYQVNTAADGNEGLKLLRDFEPELLLLDLHLAGELSGVDVLKKARSTRPDLKVVILTGFGDAENVMRECDKLGAIRLLPKPLTAGEIKQALDEIS